MMGREKITLYYILNLVIMYGKRKYIVISDQDILFSTYEYKKGVQYLDMNEVQIKIKK